MKVVSNLLKVFKNLFQWLDVKPYIQLFSIIGVYGVVGDSLIHAALKTFTNKGPEKILLLLRVKSN